jgi:hypothetical protein
LCIFGCVPAPLNYLSSSKQFHFDQGIHPDSPGSLPRQVSLHFKLQRGTPSRVQVGYTRKDSKGWRDSMDGKERDNERSHNV